MLEMPEYMVVKPRQILPKLIALALAFVLSTRHADPADPDQRPAAAGADRDALTFVYAHGFGGVKKSPEFCENLEEFLTEKGVQSANVMNYEWDSVKVDVLQAGASWIKAQENADAEAPKFKREVIDKLESEGRPYVLVAFSVGTRVVLKSLELCETELKGLRGVYFLGSAMTKDTTLKNRNALPEGMKITNYHSPLRDIVHRVSFNFMSDTPGGGQVGFEDETLFENYPVSCAHAHKGVGLATDYSVLAEAIAYLELFKHGTIVPGRTKLNLETPVMEGEVWWNHLQTVELPDGRKIELEQHTARPEYYRALKLAKDGKRYRIARGENLHAILRELGVEAPCSRG